MDDAQGVPCEEPTRDAGAELRRLRTEQKLSLAQLAAKVHYSKSYLSKLESGDKRFTAEVADKIDKVLETGGLLAALAPVRGDADLDLCPYPGLAAFGPQEARWFFGREQVTADLVARLDERLAGGGLLAVVAPSGAGKSSLLAAGLVPALAGGALPGSREWPVVATTPGAHPLSTLVDRVVAVTGTDPAAGAEVAGDPDRFAAFLTNTFACHGGDPAATSSPRVVLIVDQFEETFTECRQEEQRQAFITALCAAAESAAVLVVLGIRADFYGSCLAYPALLTALQAPVALGPMSAEQLRGIITGPAAAEGLDLEPGLVELLLRDLGVTGDRGAEPTGYDPGALPLLAHALRATWHQRHDKTLTVAGYRSTGGIHQAVATTAERAYTRLDPPEQRIAQQLLLRLVQVGAHTGDIRRRLPREQLLRVLPVPAEMTEKVLETFGRARLLTFDSTSVEITHEALLRAWPRLRQWIDTDRAGNLTRQELEEAAATWERDDRDPAGLYRGTRLAVARSWATTTHQADLSPAATAFLSASIHQQRRTTNLRRTVLVLLCALTLLASGTAVFAFQKSATAQEASETATVNEIVALADRLRSSDVSLAAQLDIIAWRRGHRLESSTALLTDANAILSTPLPGHSVALSPDQRTLASANADNTVQLWNITDPTHPTPLGPPLRHATGAMAFSNDGHILASAVYNDTTVQLWNITDPAHPTPMGSPLAGPGRWIPSVAFSPDGTTLAAGSDDHNVWLWDVATTHQPIATLKGHEAIVRSVAFSPDGKTLVSGSADTTVRLWDVTDHHHPTPLGPPLKNLTAQISTAASPDIYAVALSPDRKTLASGSADGTVQLWNVIDPAHTTPLASLPPQRDQIHTVAFSYDGNTLATGGKDNTVRLWNLTDPTHPIALGPPLTGHTNSIEAVAFSPDGNTLASGGADGTARLWHIPRTLLTGHTRSIEAVAFSPDRKTLASGNANNTVQLWNVTDPTRPTPLGPPLVSHTGPVETVAFSHDGNRLASGSDDHTVKLWDVASHQLLATLPGHTKPVKTVAFNRNGNILASGSRDNTVLLWNLTDPTHPIALGPPLIGHTNAVKTVAFNRDGNILASGSDDSEIRLWNVATHQLITTLTGNNDQVETVAFSPDGRLLASGSDDPNVQLWDVATQKLIATLRPGHTQLVYSVVFSPDGHTLATGSGDTTVRLWDVTNPTHPTLRGSPLTGHTGNVNSVAFSPDGHTLATGSGDGTIRLWTLNEDQTIQRICATTTLTSQAWEQYVPPDLPYQSPCAHP
jgi:WD40 repeat protein/transcriptional regulator with XRE-family HTH domain